MAMGDGSQGAGRVNQKQRTREALLAAASALVAAGETPTVGDAAEAARISRRTAYRYFPSQQRLLTEAALEALRPEIERFLRGPHSVEGVEARLELTVREMHRLAVANEGLLRTMIRLTIEQRASGGGEPALRGRRRVAWIEEALSPVRDDFEQAAFANLVSAISMCVGPEALLVLRDIRGLDESAAVEVIVWSTRALLRAARVQA